ncbi:MAG: hypothetical protein RMJ98_17345 [Myxococcales bacterium]|nr:hypothetical protein [Polyangiaceae bacterium]MDW8251062.1 hypothetical protein [Myxococcales bacterium]
MTSTAHERISSMEFPAPLAHDILWNLHINSQDPELFVYVELRNTARIGLFVPFLAPRPVGTQTEITLLLPQGGSLLLRGVVQWLNPWHCDGDNLNPGVGVALEGLDMDLRERLVITVSTLVFLR